MTYCPLCRVPYGMSMNELLDKKLYIFQFKVDYFAFTYSPNMQFLDLQTNKTNPPKNITVNGDDPWKLAIDIKDIYNFHTSYFSKYVYYVIACGSRVCGMNNVCGKHSTCVQNSCNCNEGIIKN